MHPTRPRSAPPHIDSTLGNYRINIFLFKARNDDYSDSTDDTTVRPLPRRTRRRRRHEEEPELIDLTMSDEDLARTLQSFPRFQFSQPSTSQHLSDRFGSNNHRAVEDAIITCPTSTRNEALFDTPLPSVPNYITHPTPENLTGPLPPPTYCQGYRHQPTQSVYLSSAESGHLLIPYFYSRRTDGQAICPCCPAYFLDLGGLNQHILHHHIRLEPLFSPTERHPI